MKEARVSPSAITGVTGLLASFLIAAPSFGQGTLTPPGAPAPTMKTLDQIEPRTPISSLPFTITNSGSYYLTTNLTGGTGITIAADDVTLDLSGFALIGGTGDGIGLSASHTNICIRNGTIRGWSQNGVGGGLAESSSLIAVRTLRNGQAGLEIGDHGLVSGCIAITNTGVGMTVGVGSRVADCTADSNSNGGILTGNGSVVKDCAVTSNTGTGISVGDDCTVHACTVRSNTSTGINAVAGSGILACIASGNGGRGVLIMSNCVVNSCTTIGNASSGIQANGGYNRIEGNFSRGNGNAAVHTANSPGGNVIIRNVLNSQSTTPSDLSGTPETTILGMNSNKNPHANFNPP